MGEYRFNCALQREFETFEGCSDNGNYNEPPTAREATIVVERVRSLGKSALPKKAHDDFDKAVDGVIRWLENKEGVGYRPRDNSDIPEARRTFTYQGEEYRVDIKPGGKTSEGAWFL
jgi:hypothetical protein